MSEFARLAAARCHDHAELAAQLARALGRSGGVWVGGRLEALARRVEPGEDPAAELHAGIAARAGVRAGLVGHGSRLYPAHEELDGPFILDPARPERLVDARSLRCDLLWRCAHESARIVLERVLKRATADEIT